MLTYLAGQKNTPENTLSELLVQEIHRILVSVGTWWSTIISLIVISVLAGFMSFSEQGHSSSNSLGFYIPLTYSVGLSMLITAPLNGLLSNRLRDDLYQGNYNPVPNALSAALTLLLPFVFILTLLLHLCFSSRSFEQGLVFAALTASMSTLWVCNNVMTLLQKDYEIIFTFFIGLFFAMTISFFIKGEFGNEGLLSALTLGFTLTSFMQYGLMLKQYKKNHIIPCYDFVKLNKKDINVFLFLTLLNSGMWIDKILYWFASNASGKLDNVDRMFRYSTYDYPFFVIFTLFSFSQFLILRKQKELLKDPQQAFSNGLFFNLPFKNLDKEKKNLIFGYRKIMYTLFSVYGSITLIILFSLYVGIFSLPWKNPFIFHILLISTLILGVFFLNLIILQYTDQYQPIAALCGLFFFLNTFGTFLTISPFECLSFLNEYQGLGFLIASLVTTVVSSIYVEQILGCWEYVVIKNIANDF